MASTATSAFGSGKREGHDASAFYRRFPAPLISADEDVQPPVAKDQLFQADAAQMTDDQVADRSVALVVTSPPYFAGKEYEAELGGSAPGSYGEYLDLLRQVLDRCRAKLEPGGRMAINVANLGRRPYRSLAADVISILQDDLGMLLRGEIIWVKAKGAGGSCAWGSFRSASNPVLRDVTERVIVASKGRFDRALSRAKRAALGLPHLSTMTTEGFLEATVDVWEIASESASRVGHPAPFPVALPRRLIELYTYQGDLVLDPFIGSGTTAVAAVETGRHYVGFEVEAAYLDIARRRLSQTTPDPTFIPQEASALDTGRAP
ncbi:MAG TPA: site-specific DNA-methyltransferase [Acidimicrobiia bacterium]|nr:site-specific DNA-methyltransferase [Acidimicrobiia bacterium]